MPAHSKYTESDNAVLWVPGSHRDARKFTFFGLAAKVGGEKKEKRWDFHYPFHQEQPQNVKERIVDQTSYNIFLI